jgi:SAM-dependent methyltransferase
MNNAVLQPPTSAPSRPHPFPTSFLKEIYNFIALPLRTALLEDATAERYGLFSLEQERINAVWPHLQGRILDIGAGNNRLVNLYGNGVGIDVHDWGGGAIVVPNTAELPFGDREFDTVCMIACLNHIPSRDQTLKEVRRVLKPGGRCIITMINPAFGFFAHQLRRHDECHKRGMKHDEVNGFWHKDVLRLVSNAQLALAHYSTFFYQLNRLYVFTKPAA